MFITDLSIIVITRYSIFWERLYLCYSMFITDLSYNSHDTILHYDLCNYMFITDLSYNSHDTILHYDLCYYMFITDLSYNSHNITRYYTMIYVTTCLSQIYHIIVITLHDTTLRFMLLHVYHRYII